MNTKIPRSGTAPTHPHTTHLPVSRSALRNDMRARRRALTQDQQSVAAADLVRYLGHDPLFRRSRHIAFYLANDGELDPIFLMQRAWEMGKVCYLPVITPGHSLWFTPYAPDDALVLNRFGIPEPVMRGRSVVRARVLDLVLLPLVAFDNHGHRLGMGGGFYDRSLAFLRHRSAWRKPRIIGIAHELQRVDALHSEPWDVPLDGVATDKDLYLFYNTQP